MNQPLFLDRLNKFPLYLLLFLFPLFFLPFTQNILGFPKLILVILCVFLSLVGWLGKDILEGKINLKVNKIFYSLLVLIFFSYLLSLIFSISKSISFFGQRLDLGDSFLSMIVFLILAFLVSNSFKKEEELSALFTPFIFGAGIAGIINILQIYKIFIFPFGFTKAVSFNTIGVPNAFAVFALSLLPISLLLAFKSKNILKIIFALVSLVLFLNLVFINFKVVWLDLLVVVLVIFSFGFKRKNEPLKLGLAVCLMLGIIASIFFYFFPVQLPGFPSLPPEISLTHNAEAYILKQSYSEGLKNIVFGTGPGTFIFDYSKYHSPLLNQTMFWGTRFLKGASMAWDSFLTKGILGGISLTFLYFLIIYLIFSHLKKDSEKEKDLQVELGLAAGALSLVVAGFFYHFNLTLYFTFWLFVGALFFYFSPQSKQIDLTSHSKIVLVNAVLLIIIILGLSLIFVQSKKFLAEYKYVKGIESFQNQKSEQAINFLSQATELDSSTDVFWRDLTQAYLSKASLISRDKKLPIEGKKRLANLATVKGSEAINQAIKTEPFNVANWNVRGYFYGSLIGLKGAESLALRSYKKAADLEPASPYTFGEIGRVYILVAQTQTSDKQKQTENLDLAIKNLNKAIELKPDYAPAHDLLAVTYDQLGQTDSAISKLEQTKKIAPRDFGLAFQLGILYWRKNELQKAKGEFERAIKLNPNYSNAHYMLGLTYDKIGERKKAISEFEKVEKANPKNKEVKKILENLRKELPALEGIGTSSGPIPELPPEIKK